MRGFKTKGCVPELLIAPKPEGRQGKIILEHRFQFSAFSPQCDSYLLILTPISHLPRSLISAFSFSPLGSPQFFRLNSVDAASNDAVSCFANERSAICFKTRYPSRLSSRSLFLLRPLNSRVREHVGPQELSRIRFESGIHGQEFIQGLHYLRLSFRMIQERTVEE